MYTRHVEWQIHHFLSLGVATIATGLLAAACGVGQAAETVVTATNATDVAVQTNLKVAEQLAQSLYGTTGSYTGFGNSASTAGSGITLTTGPSPRPSVVSFALPAVPGSPTGTVLLVAAYNGVTENCYGLLFIGAPLVTRVLGETTEGTYDITDPHVARASCEAKLLASYPEPLGSWPAGDPSSSSWPAP